ncbi:hypothetical protein EP20_001040 [Staphylococcus aureus]|uniref:3-hydroxyacyl-CoA dehydrogenase NAD-binding domain-containing protein n=1 Tax=Staphylococcus aureus TaxID=1280 RepID=UPI00070675DD|nr:3-hydroxyacyl-CoA dehydrogenase NAD-binding domain-containing protein [Staphylococcus aureus]ALK40731.1 hypothetical protein EP20_001040 [Staphylococcus aureus]
MIVAPFFILINPNAESSTVNSSCSGQKRSKSHCEKSYDKITDKNGATIRLKSSESFNICNFDDDLVNDDADLYIEAVKEDIEIKHAVWQQVLQHAKEDALFATNTSGIPINAIASSI